MAAIINQCVSLMCLVNDNLMQDGQNEENSGWSCHQLFRLGWYLISHSELGSHQLDCIMCSSCLHAVCITTGITIYHKWQHFGFVLVKCWSGSCLSPYHPFIYLLLFHHFVHLFSSCIWLSIALSFYHFFFYLKKDDRVKFWWYGLVSSALLLSD